MFTKEDVESGLDALMKEVRLETVNDKINLLSTLIATLDSELIKRIGAKEYFAFLRRLDEERNSTRITEGVYQEHLEEYKKQVASGYDAMIEMPHFGNDKLN